jgi:hypothetical protein
VTHWKFKVTHFKEDLELPILNRVDRDVLFFFGAWRNPDMQKRIRDAYPDAQWTTWKSKFGTDYYCLVKVTKVDMEKAQAGQPLDSPLP